MPHPSVLTKVQHKFQVVFWGQRTRALDDYGEGLTPADDQALPINVPGVVSQVVFMTSQVHVHNQTWREPTKDKWNFKVACFDAKKIFAESELEYLHICKAGLYVLFLYFHELWPFFKNISLN